MRPIFWRLAQGQWQGLVLWGWAALAGLWWAPVPLPWAGMAAVLAMLGALALPACLKRPRLAPMACVIVRMAWGSGALCVFAGGAQAPVTLWTALWAATALAIAFWGMAAAERRGLGWAFVAVGLVGVVVGQTLWRAGFAAQAWRLADLAQGLAAGVCVWQSRPTDREVRAGYGHARAVCLLMLLLTARSVAWPSHDGPARLPAWRAAAMALPRPETSAGGQQSTDLEALDNVGAQDSAFVRVAQALEGNAAPDALRALCPEGGWRGPLGPAWAALVQRGQLICRALGAALPETGGRWLVDHGAAPRDANLLRLIADLYWEAGDVAAAQKFAERAQILGDAYAAGDTQAAVALRGRSHAAQPSAYDAGGKLAWAGFNHVMTFDSLATASHLGLQQLEAPSRIATRFEPGRQRVVLTVQSSYGLGAGVALPVPKGAPVPASLRLDVRSRSALRLQVRTSDGFIETFDCEASGSSEAVGQADRNDQSAHRELALPPGTCSKAWRDVIVPLRVGAKGVTLTSIVLYGEYMLVSVQAIAAAPAMGAQAADSGCDLQREVCGP